MGMSTGGDDHGMMAEINVTPFVDVMLVLLIIFMVTAPMMTQGLELELPRADAPALPSDDDEQLILSITKDLTYHIGEHPFTFEELRTKLTAIAESNPGQDIFLKADGDVRYENVARVLALCKQIGLPRVGMVTQPGSLEVELPDVPDGEAP